MKLIIILLFSLNGYGQDTPIHIMRPLTALEMQEFATKNNWLLKEYSKPNPDTLYCHLQLETKSGMTRIVDGWIVQHDFYNDYWSFDKKRKYDRDKVWGYKIIEK